MSYFSYTHVVGLMRESKYSKNRTTNESEFGILDFSFISLYSTHFRLHGPLQEINNG